MTAHRISHEAHSMVECSHQRQPCNTCNTSTPRLRRDRHELQLRIVRRPPLRPAFLCRNARSGMDRYISKPTVALNFSRGGASADSSSSRRSKSQTPRGPVIGIFPAPIPADNVKRIPPETSGTERSNIHEIDGPEPDVRAIPARTGLSQAAFARSIGVAKGTLVNWEQRRRRPEGPARVLLALIDKDPTIVQRTLRR